MISRFIVQNEITILQNGLTLDYPLRPDFIAQVVIPRDLTTEEARRMVAFLLALTSNVNNQ